MSAAVMIALGIATAAHAGAVHAISCKNSDSQFSHLTASNTSCREARKTERAWQGDASHPNLACAKRVTCTSLNGYRCTTSFFRGRGGVPSGHISCKRGARRVKFDFRS